MKVDGKSQVDGKSRDGKQYMKVDGKSQVDGKSRQVDKKSS
jgi:hypothetical protein